MNFKNTHLTDIYINIIIKPPFYHERPSAKSIFYISDPPNRADFGELVGNLFSLRDLDEGDFIFPNDCLFRCKYN